MARRANYGFEKRQKEIKKEQKRMAKLEKKHGQKASQETEDAANDGPPPIQQHEAEE